MRKIKCKLRIGLMILVFMISCVESFAYTDYTEEQSYVYNRLGKSVKIPAAYEYKNSVNLKRLEDMDITSPVDMFVKQTGEVFIVEAELGAILCFNENLELVDILKEFTMPNGETTTLKKPQGVFVSESDVMYIADTENNRVLVCDRDGKVSLEIVKPSNLLGTDLTSFLPVKVVADSAGRISIIARNINSGIMQFSAEGSFIGYTGAPSVKMDAFTRLLRKFSTDKQKAQMQTYVPTEYNNIKIDQKNFIWGTISSISVNNLLETINSQDVSGAVTPIKKLNTMGTDVLRRKGLFPPVGELNFIDTPSKITDVAIGPNNIYSLLDNQKGRIFTYNNDGILLYVFGSKGTKKGNSQTPVAIDYIGDEIVLLDSGLCQLVIYEPTTYGKLLIDAEGHYEDGNYEMANQLWKQVAELNSNFGYAYIGLGNAEYSTESYEEAMEYYEYADDSVSYSKAKEKLRKKGSQKIFPIVFIGVVGLIIVFLSYKIIRRVRRYIRGEGLYRREEEE